MKKRIAIDIDEVIADGTLSICEQINELNGTHFNPSDWHTQKRKYPGFYHDFPRKHNLQYGVEYLKTDMTKDQSHVPLMKDVMDVLPKLAKRADVTILTARDLAWKQETLRWLERKFGDIFKQIIFSREHPAGPTKMGICNALDIDYAVEDRIEFLADSGSTKPILFGDFAWHIDVPPHLIRCKNWREVEEYFEREL